MVVCEMCLKKNKKKRKRKEFYFYASEAEFWVIPPLALVERSAHYLAVADMSSYVGG
jgi:hypothetical protein